MKMISFIFSFPLLLSFTNSKIQFGPRLSTQVQKNPINATKEQLQNHTSARALKFRFKDKKIFQSCSKYHRRKTNIPSHRRPVILRLAKGLKQTKLQMTKTKSWRLIPEVELIRKLPSAQLKFQPRQHNFQLLQTIWKLEKKKFTEDMINLIEKQIQAYNTVPPKTQT